MLPLRFSRVSVFVLILLGLTSASVCAEEKQILVYRASHAPILELEKALTRLLNGQKGVRIASARISNSLAIAGDSEALEQIAAMLAQLDRTPEMIRVHVYVIQPEGEIDRSELAGELSSVESAVRNLTKAGKVSVVNEVHLTTLEQQDAVVQAGKTIAVPSGRSARSIPSSVIASMERRAADDERMKSQLAALRSRTTTSYQRMNIGSLVRATSSIGREGAIYVDLAWERSDVVDSDVEDGQAGVTQATAETRIMVKDGDATLVQEITDPMLGSRWLLVVGAETTNRSYETASDNSRRDGNDIIEFGSVERGDAADQETEIPEKYMVWAQATIKRYDRDGDGMLSSSERQDMRRPPRVDADSNTDGLVSVEEFARSVLPK